jgi:type IV pilus assembly protein PilA
MKDKKGFTLIELLAIIVILAIIAVITVPIILNIIDNSKKGAAIDSALGYKDAIQKYYLLKRTDDVSHDLPSGVKLVSMLPDNFTVSGNVPSSDSWIQLEKGQVVAYSLKFGDYVVTKYKDSDVSCEKGEVQENEEIIRQQLEKLEFEKQVAKNNAVNYVISLESLTDKVISDVRNVSDLNELVDIDVEPTEGWIQFNDSGFAVKYSLRFGDYVINYDGNNQIVNIGDVDDKPILISGITIDGVKYYDTSWINKKDLNGNAVNAIYYDPGEVGHDDVPARVAGKCTAGENNCKKWYAYSEFSQNGKTYVNLLLDRNTSLSVAWASKSDYEGNDGSTRQSIVNSVGISYPGSKTFGEYNANQNSKGPLTILNQLHMDTDSWNLPLRTDSYTPASNSYSNYTIDYSGYKARLISAEEIAIIIRKNTVENLNAWRISSSSSADISFGSLNSSLYSSQNDVQKERQRSYSWLFDNTDGCIDFGCSVNSSYTYGYWTSTPSVIYNAQMVFYVSLAGKMTMNTASSGFGVRPVITVLASDVL